MASPLHLRHALIGGLIGAAVTHAGFASLNSASILHKILLPMVLSPLAGFARELSGDDWSDGSFFASKSTNGQQKL